ncbi:hypothetical protein BC936DRAFT_150079 [Jimgerdemannia flammicorona]|uniref:Uncharacterized protein n=1 Tax=Jimgerdemannia flammicorona TaxID=994334 RepID=A0A433CZK0_9FUNG|nr:hypothetical protein BC936DRAFT_150079 [Jimgerdemannia flammicorona]
MATIIKPFFNPNTSSDPYSNDFSDSELCDEFDSMGVHPNSTTSMHPRPSASKATLWRKRQPRSLPKTGNVLVNEALSRRVNLNMQPAISLPSYYDIEPDFKETRVFSQAPPAAAAPHTYEEVESSFASSTGSLFQSVYDNWQNEEARSGAVPEIDGRHTTASSRTSSSIFELYQQDSSRNPISGMNIESRLLDKNFHPDSALRGQTNGMSTELTRGEGLPPPLPTRSLVKHQGRERLHERGQTSFDVVEEEDEEYSNYKYNNEDDGLNDNYNRKNSGDTSSAVPASVHPFSFQQLPLLSGMPFPIHSNFSSPHHVNTSPFLNEDKRSQILEWNQKHDYTTSPPQSRDPSPTRAISRTPVAARALPEYSGPTSTDSDQVDSPRSSFGPHRAREMSYDSTSTVHAGLALHILERRRNSQAEALLARRASRPILRDEDRFVIMGVESDDPDKVSGESEADAIDEIPEAQAEKVAPRKDEQNVTPVSVPTLVTPATEDDNGSICVIRDASVGLVDGDDESTPGDRVVVFRIKDGNVKQTSVGSPMSWEKGPGSTVLWG